MENALIEQAIENHKMMGNKTSINNHHNTSLNDGNA
jgi:hypothetical protein